ncbi:MAG: hypothetical protein ACYC35_25455 [Pirellulales bacterium]
MTQTPCPYARCPAATEGERRKLDALATLEAHRDLYVLRGRRAMLSAMLLDDGTATADDVRAAVALPARIGPRCLGAVPSILARLGIIRADGYAVTRRPEAHGRPVRLWRLVDRAAALRWLADHPDPADPPADNQADRHQARLPL